MKLKVHVAIVASAVPTARYPFNGIFEWDQAKALAGIGINVDYLAIDLRSFRRIRPWGIIHGETDGVSWHSFSIPIGPSPLNIRIKIGVWALRRLYQKVFDNNDKPNIFHAHFEEMGYMTAKLSGEEKIPFVVTEHSSDILERRLSKDFLSILRESHAKADKIISVSDTLKESIYKHTGRVAEVIPNIVSGEFKYLKEKHLNFVFVSTAALIESKRIRLVVEAFNQVRKIYDDVCLEIIGDGPEQKELKLEVKRLKITEKVHFNGALSRERIAAIYKSCDCFVLPSAFETFGVVYIEAMAAGLPVIATRCGGPEDFVTEKNGILVAVDDVDALKDAMLSMYLSRKKYDCAAIAAAAKAQFSADVIAERLLDVYAGVLKKQD